MKIKTLLLTCLLVLNLTSSGQNIYEAILYNGFFQYDSIRATLEDSGDAKISIASTDHAGFQQFKGKFIPLDSVEYAFHCEDALVIGICMPLKRFEGFSIHADSASLKRLGGTKVKISSLNNSINDSVLFSSDMNFAIDTSKADAITVIFEIPDSAGNEYVTITFNHNWLGVKSDICIHSGSKVEEIVRDLRITKLAESIIIKGFPYSKESYELKRIK